MQPAGGRVVARAVLHQKLKRRLAISVPVCRRLRGGSYENGGQGMRAVRAGEAETKLKPRHCYVRMRQGVKESREVGLPWRRDTHTGTYSSCQ